MDAERIVISTITTTLNRGGYLKRCLESLVNQSTLPDEVIIVDNGSSDNTQEVIDCFRSRLPLRYVIEYRQGISIARNAGIRCARGNIVAFTDDDCILDRDWIKKIKESHMGYPNSHVVGGKVENAFKDKLIPRLQQYIYILWFNMINLRSFSLRDFFRLYSFPLYTIEAKSITTNNISYKKKVFSSVGYFNENLITNEDAELSFRIGKSGRKILYNPEITVYHFHRASLKTYVMQAFALGKGLSQWRENDGEVWNNSIVNLKIRYKCLFLLALLIYPAYILIEFHRLQDSMLLIPFFIVREIAVFLGYCHESI